MWSIRGAVTGIIRNAPRLDALVVALLATIAVPHAAAIDRMASLEDAFVDVDHGANRWTIGNGLEIEEAPESFAQVLVLEPVHQL